MRCSHCGQQNPDQYLYCATCGAPLGKAPAAGATAEPPVVRQGPGQGRAASYSHETRDVSYLLEDDEPRKSRVAPVIVVLSLIALGVFAWRELRPMFQATTPTTEVASTSVPAATPQPAEQIPAPEPAPPPVVPAPAATAPAESSKGNESATPAESPTVSERADGSSEAEASPTATEPEIPPTKPVASKPVAKPAPKPAPPPDPVKRAEAYLYGRGVPQNCERAVSMLKAEADKSNVKARSTLGSMYATGHCVARDLPTAYRYFALVLRTDPENTAASQNLENIWKQMTPPERQAAVK